MNWKQLAQAILEMPEEQQEQDVTIYLLDANEYFPIHALEQTGEDNDVLDPGHVVLVVDETGEFDG